jgi:hypothetical protein
MLYHHQPRWSRIVSNAKPKAIEGQIISKVRNSVIEIDIDDFVSVARHAAHMYGVVFLARGEI